MSPLTFLFLFLVYVSVYARLLLLYHEFEQFGLLYNYVYTKERFTAAAGLEPGTPGLSSPPRDQ